MQSMFVLKFTMSAIMVSLVLVLKYTWCNKKCLQKEGFFKQSTDDGKWAENYSTVILYILLLASISHVQREKRKKKKAWSSSVLFIFM